MENLVNKHKCIDCGEIFYCNCSNPDNKLRCPLCEIKKANNKPALLMMYIDNRDSHIVSYENPKKQAELDKLMVAELL